MKEPLKFYVIDEHADDIKYCKRKGMVPCKTENGSVKQYLYKGFVYDVLECTDSFSGYAVTLMRFPELSYGELLHTALNSKKDDEIIGSIGMILKKYPKEFEKYLQSLKLNSVTSSAEKRKIKRLISYTLDIYSFSDCMHHLTGIWEQCNNLKKQLNNGGKYLGISKTLWLEYSLVENGFDHSVW